MRRNKNILFNTTLNKQDYQFYVDSLMIQIVQNWCLCKYCQLKCPDWIAYNQWKDELIDYLNKLQRKRVKGNRKKWTEEIIIKKAEFNTLEVVKLACETRLVVENDLQFSTDERIKLYNLFIDFLPQLISCIAKEISVTQLMKEFE